MPYDEVPKSNEVEEERNMEDEEDCYSDSAVGEEDDEEEEEDRREEYRDLERIAKERVVVWIGRLESASFALDVTEH